jgi:hypothetical protein
MRMVSLVVTLAIMGFGASGGRVAHFVRTAYPSDLAQREALQRCSIGDSKFSRFSRHDREDCYQENHVVAALPRVAGQPPAPEPSLGLR